MTGRWNRSTVSSIGNEPHGAGRGLLLVLAGAAIGAATAMLLAPKKGSEIREAIGRGYRKTVEQCTGRAQQLRDRAQDIGGGIREHVPNLLRFRRHAGGVERQG